jgi:uncharacterized membrane protein (DUF106 family)
MIPLVALFDVGMKVLDKFIPDPEAKAKAQKELLQMQQEGRLAELNADNIEAQELTKRQQADMGSDSWLSKNIRPLSLIALFFAYIIFAVMSAFGINTNDNYTMLLGQWGQLAFGFYFGSRGLEKIAEIRAKKNKSK